MDEFKLCFFEEFTTKEGKDHNRLISHENHLNLLCLVSNDEDFAKITTGAWREIMTSDDFKHFLTTGSESFNKDRKLALSVACLMTFIQDNFTGPDLDLSEDFFRFKTFDDEKWKLDRISVDGIELNGNIRHISLLIIAKNFLEDLIQQFPEDLVSFTLSLIHI